jgi:hypothetical protein
MHLAESQGWLKACFEGADPIHRRSRNGLACRQESVMVVVLPSRLRRAALGALGLLLLLSAPRLASAQGCVAARMDSPAVGAGVGAQSLNGHWEVFTSFRHFRSDKHFVGHDHQEDRDKEHSQVVNDTNILTTGFVYTMGPRWSFALSVPYVDIDRSSALRDPTTRVVIDRASMHSSGIGDSIFIARRWMLDSHAHPTGNVALGIGMKFPTGDKDLKDWRTRIDSSGNYTKTYENVDQSIQPGDGGLGYVFELRGFKSSQHGGATFYGAMSYLFNPEETDHVATGRSGAGEEFMSIADQYLGRVGVMGHGKSWGGWSAGGGMRIEGVPVHDVFGGSDWFRRPGYSLSVEPSMAWTGSRNSVALAIPVTVDANRQVSVPDRKRGAHGDAAFADWSMELTYSHSFGSKAACAASSAAHDMN